MFVAVDKITNGDAVKAAKLTKTPDASAPKPLARYNCPIKIHDHVIFYNKYNKLCRGVAKWIGTSKSNDTAVVGIEVVSTYNYVD